MEKRMENILKKLKKENNSLQASIGSTNDCTVDNLLTEMDAARMGAVDREVVRRDLIAMVQEREGLGTPIPMQLDEESKEMCRQIVSNTGYRSRLEMQLYIVMCIAIYFFVNDMLIVLNLFGGVTLANLIVHNNDVTWKFISGVTLNIIWYYVVYLGYRQKCLFKKKAKGLSPFAVFGIFYAVFVAGNLIGVLFYNMAEMFVNNIYLSYASFFVGLVVDTLILFISKYSYEKYTNAQCRQYGL